MVHMTPGDLPGLPVEQLAQFLLECAKDDPALLSRSSAQPVAGHAQPVIGREPGIRLPPVRPPEVPPFPLRLSTPRSDPEMEELVSIAVACARRAEDALEHARQVSATARRRMSVVAMVTGFSVVAAAAVVWFDRNGAMADPRLAEVTSAMHGVSDLTRQTFTQLTAVRSDVAALRDSPPGGQAPIAAVADAVDPAARVTTTDASGKRSVRPAPAATPAGTATVASPQVAPNEVRAPEAAAPATEPQQAGSSDQSRPAQYATPVGAPAVVSTDPVAPTDSPVASPIEVDPAHSPASPRYHVARQRGYHEARGYRPAPRPRYYIPSPPVVLAQVVADMRRNIHAIFH
jgi:hypothetical protein